MRYRHVFLIGVDGDGFAGAYKVGAPVAGQYDLDGDSIVIGSSAARSLCRARPRPGNPPAPTPSPAPCGGPGNRAPGGSHGREVAHTRSRLYFPAFCTNRPRAIFFMNIRVPKFVKTKIQPLFTPP